MIKSFNEFNRIDESVLYYAHQFREQLEILKKGGSDIASNLLELEMEDLPTDITFVNSAEDVGYLTFHPMAKAIEKIRKTYSPGDDDSEDPLDLQANPNKKYHDTIYNNEVKILTRFILVDISDRFLISKSIIIELNIISIMMLV